MSEINIIPFTDIVLVILITFMVTAPVLIQSAIKVKLPKTQLSNPVTQSDNVKIVITESNKIYLNDKEQSLASFESQIEVLLADKAAVIVNADRNTNYGIVAKVLSIAQKHGAAKLELLTQYQSENK
ncbi:MAG: hypothetical protein DKM50_04360 [Candidatus Margulisiibacteriota bacterium]|nr:MAG: hypothetical protein DKM50_04360 [Candidatus Margulisiibacteriota bacterium]HAR61906.1 hypothetical protein [Candidatus Margulisiibacteriota bacterium]HCT84470.1 hypothetical protein [Candidatus Margulisiibacteriota bacterium]HCY35895.1 hypothetical protein [Candidatus Margulisiibacteriota bacterium]